MNTMKIEDLKTFCKAALIKEIMRAEYAEAASCLHHSITGDFTRVGVDDV